MYGKPTQYVSNVASFTVPFISHMAFYGVVFLLQAKIH